MNIDFTLKTYENLLKSLIMEGYSFQRVSEFIKTPNEKVVLLRHDVDAKNKNSLEFAQIQHKYNITGTYYFRIIPKSFDEGIIREIYEMGHEIGYHYEDLDFSNGDINEAFTLFKNNLKIFREVCPISSICMHGSPLSNFDNRDIWKHFDYKELDIIAEPYFDLDFSKVLYITDTGRTWNGESVSIRDKSPYSGEFVVKNSLNKFDLTEMVTKAEVPLSSTFKFIHTSDIIKACSKKELPNQIMINFHPQRWTSNPIQWITELILQKSKNRIKYLLNRFKK